LERAGVPAGVEEELEVEVVEEDAELMRKRICPRLENKRSGGRTTVLMLLSARAHVAKSRKKKLKSGDRKAAPKGIDGFFASRALRVHRRPRSNSK